MSRDLSLASSLRELKTSLGLEAANYCEKMQALLGERNSILEEVNGQVHRLIKQSKGQQQTIDRLKKELLCYTSE